MKQWDSCKDVATKDTLGHYSLLIKVFSEIRRYRKEKKNEGAYIDSLKPVGFWKHKVSEHISKYYMHTHTLSFLIFMAKDCRCSTCPYYEMHEGQYFEEKLKSPLQFWVYKWAWFSNAFLKSF